jgi:MFS family permease
MRSENPFPPPTHREASELDARGRAVPDARRSLLRNVGINVVGEGLWGFGAAVIAPTTVLVTFLQKHGAGEGTAGALSAIEGGAGLFQVAGPFLFRSHRHRKRQLMRWFFIVALPALYAVTALLACGGIVGDAALRALVLAAIAIFNCALGAAAGMWNDWFAHLFDARVRGTISGIMWCGMAVSMALGGVVAGMLLGALPVSYVYVVLYAIGSVACTVSIAAFAWIDDPAESAPDEEPPRGRALLDLLMASWSAPKVRALLIARVLGNAAFAVSPFLVLRYTSDVGGALSSRQIVTCGIGLTVGTAVASLGFGRFGDRWGHRRGMLFAFVLAAAAHVSALFLVGIGGCVVTYTLLGLGAGAWLASGYLIHETTPHGSRLAQLIACNLVLAVAGLVIPIGWGALATCFGLPVLLVACLLSATLGLLWALVAVREPRSVETRLEPAA